MVNKAVAATRAGHLLGAPPESLHVLFCFTSLMTSVPPATEVRFGAPPAAHVTLLGQETVRPPVPSWMRRMLTSSPSWPPGRVTERLPPRVTRQFLLWSKSNVTVEPSGAVMNVKAGIRGEGG